MYEVLNMKYMCKRELDKIYKVEASFYYRIFEDEQLLCRRVADIKKRNGEASTIDAYFVMMNPGSCKVKKEYEHKIGRNESVETEFIDSDSDATMARVMNIMQEMDWQYIRMINISDFVNGNSESANKRVAMFIEKSYDAHCIFSENRRKELVELTKDDAVFIKAWGCSKEIHYYAQYALDFLKDKRTIGIDNGEGRYLHIKPPRKDLQVSIATQLIEQIKNSESSL